REVTIYAPTAFLADALDDAVFILGPKKGLALVDGFPDCGALIVDADNQVWTSKVLEGKLHRTAAPTDGICSHRWRKTTNSRQTLPLWAAASWAARSRCVWRRAAWPSPSSS